jgi:hypothetical protein
MERLKDKLSKEAKALKESKTTSIDLKEWIPCNTILSLAHVITYNFFRWGLYAKLGHEWRMEISCTM